MREWRSFGAGRTCSPPARPPHRGGEERLTFSVLWEMSPEIEVVSTTFTKGLIKSRAALTYKEAQARIDDVRGQDELTMGLRLLNKIAKVGV